MYVLLGKIDYEGDVLLGVYTSEALAEAAYEAHNYQYDDHVVYYCDLDASAHDHF